MNTALQTPSRLRVDPSFVQAQTLDGRPFIAKDSEPYTQFWLSERERLLLAQFGGRHGADVAQARAAYLRASGKADTPAERQRVARSIREMSRAGVLLSPADDSSRYCAAIAPEYIAQRPFPRAIARSIIEKGPVGANSAVLDLAGGPGDLALALAAVSPKVTLMELSRGFVQTAARRARGLGLPLNTVHDSANRLLHHEGHYDVVTVAQALHWLDDVAVCRGVCRLLLPDGSFFVVHAEMEVGDSHPLAHLLGHASILGAHPRRPFVDSVQPMLQRLALLFQALDNSGMAPIAPAAVNLLRQRRPFGPGFARGFFTPRHIELTGQTSDAFHRDIEARCAAQAPAAGAGTQHWAVLHFKRGAAGVDATALSSLPVADIAFDGPSGN